MLDPSLFRPRILFGDNPNNNNNTPIPFTCNTTVERSLVFPRAHETPTARAVYSEPVAPSNNEMKGSHVRKNSIGA